MSGLGYTHKTSAEVEQDASRAGLGEAKGKNFINDNAILKKFIENGKKIVKVKL